MRLAPLLRVVFDELDDRDSTQLQRVGQPVPGCAVTGGREEGMRDRRVDPVRWQPLHREQAPEGPA